MKHILIENGLAVHLLQTRKFKTNVITVLLRTDLTRENATQNAVIAGVLKSGCRKYQTALEIAKECEEMYGAELDVGVVKKGEEHIIQLYLEVLNDINGASNFDSAGELLRSLLFEPLTENGAFKPEYVALQTERQRRVIEGKLNDKRKYARERCVEIMCEKERFGVSGDGYTELLEQLTPKSLYSRYERLIEESPIEIGIIGDIDVYSCEKWADKFFARGSRKIRYCEPAAVLGVDGGMKTASEKLCLNQAKLVIGARCDISPKNGDFYRLLLFNEITGGGAHSKLFKNVREARGLCYYIGSAIYRAKSIMLIEAGIDEKECGEALELITDQFEQMKTGGISEDELAQAKGSIISQMETLKDSPQGLTDFYMTNALLDDSTEISAMRGIFSRMTVDDMCACAKRIEFDTAFILT